MLIRPVTLDDKPEWLRMRLALSVCLILYTRVGVMLATMSTCRSVMWMKAYDEGRCEV